MNKLSNDQIQVNTKSLSEKYNTNEVRYVGHDRYVVSINPVKYNTQIGIILTKYDDLLFDENGNHIEIDMPINNIMSFTCQIGTVCTNEFLVKDGIAIATVKKFGLIDKNGKTLLPCIYDSIHVHLDGFVEITKDGVEKSTNAAIIFENKFNFDTAI